MTNSGRSRGLAVLIFGIPLFVSAQGAPYEPEPIVLPEMVVTATRGETPTKQVGSSVTVITAEEIEKSQKTSVADILRTVPGLDVVRTGGNGQQVSVFTRGSNSNHTLVLIDGIEATDPSNPTNQFDFSSLQVDDIERIEVVRGPQSSLYGSDAIGGVIQIFTRRGHTARSYAQVEAGSFGSTAARGGIHGGDKWVSYGLTFNLQDTDGVSAFKDGDEDDAYDSATLATYVSARPTTDTTVDFSLRRVDATTDIDSFLADDTDSQLDSEEWFSRLQGGLALLDGRWTQTLGLSYTDYDRKNENGPEPASTTPGESRFTGEKTKFDWVHKFQAHPDHLLTFGLETEEEKAKLSDGETPGTGTDAVFLQNQARLSENFFTTIGVRRDSHDEFGGVTTYQLAPVYVLADTGTRLRAAYGTGFKAPSLSALFEDFPEPTCGGLGFDCSFFSNPNLKPERSKGWEIGVEQSFDNNRIQLGLTYFRQDIRDLISFAPLGTCDFTDPVPDCSAHLDNVNEASIKGYELSARYVVLPALTLGLDYTKTKALDEATNQDLLRRPRKKASLHADWQALPELSVTFAGRHVGERDDFVGFAVGTLDSYTVFDTALAYTLTPQWTVLGRIENAFDEDYEEVSGFGAPGRGLFAGLRFTPE